MRIIDQYHEWESLPDRDWTLRLLESAGRTCWKSEGKACDGSAPRFVSSIVKRNHESVLEHVSATARLVTDRGVTHELVRHRIGMAYSQESQRYVRNADGLTFIRPVYWGYHDTNMRSWEVAMSSAETYYLGLLACGAKPQEARAVLPNSTKTEIVVTGNLRAWKHVLKLRTASDAHPQIRALMLGVKRDLVEWLPEVFGGEQ